MSTLRLIAFAVSLASCGALAQTCGTLNQNQNCVVGALPEDSSTVYYAPTDSGNIEFFGQAEGACDSGTYADVSFYKTLDDSSPGNFITDCGCLPLDGSQYVLDCGISKGTIQEGGYHFLVSLDPSYDAVDRFNIVHSQVTSTAATPTSTATVYTYETDTTTSETTYFATTTNPQATVTSPAGTVQQTMTITPSPTTATITDTKTYTCTEFDVTLKKRTAVKTGSCKTLRPCPTQHKSHGYEVRRDVVQGANGYTVTGDGPPTTTVTPSPIIVTETDNGGTTTETDYVSTTSTYTVDPTPLTTTVYSGTATNVSTTTLPQMTRTVKAHTTTHVTSTKTFTFTYTSTRTTHLPCSKR